MFAVIHRDERIIVLDKPAGLLSVPGIGPARADCLAVRVQADIPAARVVHRLDQGTSGVIVMALDAESQRHLGRQFEQRLVEKQYLAVVFGTPCQGQGTIDLPLRADIQRRPYQIVDAVHGRAARTDYRLIARHCDRSRLELHPLTGRSHQLRVHLREIGHPILGDDLYAPPAVMAMADRLLLHACALTVTHPTSGERLTFRSPCPF